MDLFGREFVVLTGSPEWTVAAKELGLTAHEPTGDWTAPYGVTDEGAVLVRPDGFVAWRSVGEGPATDLARALRTVLAR